VGQSKEIEEKEFGAEKYFSEIDSLLRKKMDLKDPYDLLGMVVPSDQRDPLIWRWGTSM